MTQGERVREVRKKLSMTMEKFGKRIGVGKSSISNIENGQRSLTEHMTKSICREFNVDYMWLTTGEGEMFADSDLDFYNRIDQIMAGEDENVKCFFKSLLELSDDEIDALDSLLDKVIQFSEAKNKDTNQKE